MDTDQRSLSGDREVPGSCPATGSGSTSMGDETARIDFKGIPHFLQSMFNAITESVFLMNVAGEVIAANTEVAQRLGCSSPEDMVGRNIYDLLTPEDAERRRGYVRQVLATGQPHRVVDERSGRTISNSIYPVVELDGSISSLAVFGEDITDLKRAEEELRRQKAELEQAQQIAHMGRWELDLKTNELKWSDTIFTIFQIDPAEFGASYEAFLEVVHPDDREELDRVYHRSVAEHMPYEIEHRLLLKDGTVKWVRETCQTEYDQGGAIRSTGIVQDITDQKLAEDRLRRNQQLLEMTEHLSGVGGWEWDIRQQQLSWTDETYRLHGFDPEAVGTSAGLIELSLACYDPEDSDRIRTLFDRCVRFGEPYDVECFFTSQGGERRRIRTRGMPVREKGIIVRVIGIFMDITELKQAQDALERRLAAVTHPLEDCAPIGIEELFNIQDLQKIQDDFSEAFQVASLITDTHGRPVTTPSNFTRLCADVIRQTEKGRINCFKSDAVLGRYHPGGPIVEPCHSCGLWDAGASISVGGRHVASWLVGQVRDATQTEEGMRAYADKIGADHEELLAAFFEVPAMSLDEFKRIADLLFTMANQLSDQAYHNVQQARFITERKRAEEILRAEKAWFDAIINSAPVIVVGLGAGSEIKIFNAFAERLTGYRADEVMGKAWIEQFIPESLRSQVHEVWELIMQNGLIEHHFENEILTRDGDIRLVSWSNTILAPAGEEPMVLSIGADITDQRQSEEEQNRLREQLIQAQKMESIGRLAGGIAHDFNNMLSVILGHLELALSDLNPEQPLYENLSEVRQAAEHSADLTRQLLAFARKQTVAPRMLDLNQTVAATLKLLERLIGEDIELAWEPGENLWPVRMDPSQVDQILTNLCVNARDAIDGPDGRIMIRSGTASLDDQFCIHHPGSVPGEYSWLVVQDNGCGMDAQTLDNLFEPFFTTKKIGAGVGLGLPSVYGAVKQNNGFIDVVSAPGEGAIFTIYLPRCHDGEDADVENAGHLPAEASTAVILLVEDEPSILTVTARMLERLGYQVVSAARPGECMQLAAGHAGQIDLLITDVVMPEMNGRELAKQLLKLHPEMKRLFMSGYTADVIASHGVLDPGVHFMQKPFSMDELAKKVRSVLDLD